jgi:hypothetical protein
MAQQCDERAAKGGGGTKPDQQIEAEHRGRQQQRQRHRCLHDPARQAMAAGQPCGQRRRQQQQAECGQASEAQGQA